ncbi:MAG TPA: RNA polymerase sigma factor [Acidimicrobiales bacterium]|nr:RNA polymerase sigma factor [Acidimicrobiales bacterium]
MRPWPRRDGGQPADAPASSWPPLPLRVNSPAPAVDRWNVVELPEPLPTFDVVRDAACDVEHGPGSLADLVAAAQAGDSRAWESLYRSLYPRLVAFARRGLGPDEARDAVSEAMIRAVAGIHRFRWRGGGFEGWLFAILRNVIADRWRRGERERAALQRARDERDEHDLAERLVASDEARSVRAAFLRLTDADQELLYLRVVLGLSAEAVGTVLGKRPGAVRMAQARALERLRRHLAETEP